MLLATTDCRLHSFTLKTTRLPAGHAVTVWWMVVNSDASVSLLYAAGHVFDASGAAGFGGALKVGDTKGVVNLPGLSTQRLLDAAGADVYLVVRDHDPGQTRHRQPADRHLRCVQPDLHRPADVGACGRLRQPGTRRAGLAFPEAVQRVAAHAKLSLP
jgi:hypothetical protein